MFEELIKIDNCECGRSHELTTKHYIVKEGAIADLPGLLADLGLEKSPICVYDTNTMEAAGERMHDCVKNAEDYVFEVEPGTLLHPLDSEIYPLADHMKAGDYSVAISVGGGVITDITRYAAFLAGLPLITVPTCASVDGFVSNTCAVVLNNMKTSAPAKSPVAVCADVDVISQAPSFLAASGVGDMIAKYLAIAEWKIGLLTQDEYYCPRIAGCAIDATNAVVDNVELIAKRDKQAYSKLIEGLLLSSIAMQLATITRPASSFEHHFSHYLETIPGTNSDENALHGEKVGVGTLIAHANYHEMILALGRIADGAKNRFSTEFAVSHFLDKPERIQEAVARENQRSTSEDLKPELLKKNFDEILKIEGELPTYEKLRKTLETVGGKLTYKDLDLTRDMTHRVFSTCCYIRNRYTTLRNVNDFDTFDFSKLVIPE